jgi:hypothetical protein
MLWGGFCGVLLSTGLAAWKYILSGFRRSVHAARPSTTRGCGLQLGRAHIGQRGSRRPMKDKRLQCLPPPIEQQGIHRHVQVALMTPWISDRSLRRGTVPTGED